MQQSQILKVKISVKQYTANLKEILNKASKEHAASRQEKFQIVTSLNIGSEVDAGRLTAVKHPTSHLKQLTKNEQRDLIKSKSYLEDKNSYSTSYRSKHKAVEGMHRTNSRKRNIRLNKVDGLSDITDDFSIKKMSYVEPREMPSQSIIKYKTKDNFFTPKVQQMDQGDSYLRLRNKSSQKIEKIKKRSEEDPLVVAKLKQKIANLQRHRDLLEMEIEQYKLGLLKVAQKFHKLEDQLQESRKYQEIASLLREQLNAERNRNKQIVWRLRAEQLKLVEFRKKLLDYTKKEEETTRDTLKNLSSLAYQNKKLRLMLKIANGKEMPESQYEESNEGQLTELKQVNLFLQQDKKINPKQYLLLKLDELKEAATAVKVEEKRIFNFSIPINKSEEDRDAYEDQAIAMIKKSSGQPPN